LEDEEESGDEDGDLGEEGRSALLVDLDQFRTHLLLE
jgi:hypothetical protein